MLRISDPLQPSLFDPFSFLGPKRMQLLQNGWPFLFREYLYSELPVDKIKSAFHTTMGRPTKELHTVLGVLVLQQLFDLTDQQVVSQLAFNIEWHYALNLLDEEDDSKYICERTLRFYRALVTGLKGDEILFRSITDQLLQLFKVPTEKQRLDSTHIVSDMRRLSRLELLVKTVEKFVRVMQHDHPKILKKNMAEELITRYLEPEKKGCFSQVKPSEAERTLQQVAEDLLVLVETFCRHPKIRKMKVYALLERVLAEQCEVHGESEETKVILKDPKEVVSTSLQNPSDPDATYDGYKGPGYQAQLMGTYQEEEENDSTQPNLMTYVQVEPAHESDSDALLPAVEETQERGCAPEELLADSMYGSDDNVQAAAKEGTDLIAPTMGKPKKKEEMLILDDFIVDEESGEVIACPAGETPTKTRETPKGVQIVNFDPEVCQQCDHREYCCVGLDEAKHELKSTPKQRRLAQRRVQEESEEFQEKYRHRSGIEATISHLKRDLNMKRLRIRGLAKVRYAVVLKVLGWNIQQAVRARKARIVAGFYMVFSWVAGVCKRFNRIGNTMGKLAPPEHLKPAHSLPSAA